MVGLVVAGEAVFGLPFHLARFFRPTLLAVFELTKTELGAAQAIYGVVAMLAYFPGGPVADRFGARKLLTASLLSTAAGGLYLATIPSRTGVVVVWGFWGATTILLFWAALIRATRRWGGTDRQGMAYGVLDGGRGLLAAGFATAAVFAFSFAFPDDAATITIEHRSAAFQNVIYAYTGLTVFAAGLVWVSVPDEGPPGAGRRGLANAERFGLLHKLRTVVAIPGVWLQALIVGCAYVGFKGFDNYGLYASEAYGMSEVDAAVIATLGAWVRPIAAIAAGFLGDRLRASRVIIVLFALLLASDLYFALVPGDPSALRMLLANVLLASIAIYGFRGLYFALFEEAKVPMAVTGTAVGIVSVVGYTPDIFVSLVGGVLLDRNPGPLGHQHFFWFLAGFAALGLAAAVAFERVGSRSSGDVASN